MKATTNLVILFDAFQRSLSSSWNEYSHLMVYFLKVRIQNEFMLGVVICSRNLAINLSDFKWNAHFSVGYVPWQRYPSVRDNHEGTILSGNSVCWIHLQAVWRVSAHSAFLEQRKTTTSYNFTLLVWILFILGLCFGWFAYNTKGHLKCWTCLDSARDEFGYNWPVCLSFLATYGIQRSWVVDPTVNRSVYFNETTLNSIHSNRIMEERKCVPWFWPVWEPLPCSSHFVLGRLF